MALILSLETATTNCSVALSKDGKILSTRSINNGFSHSEKINIFIEQVIQEAGVVLKDLDAIAVSVGPGSYTGLRIGLSTAKGLCFGLDLPLIAVSTLEAMAVGIKALPNELIVPMIDARRMEAYCAVYDEHNKMISGPEPIVIDEKFYERFRKDFHLVVAGDGADKCISLFQNDNTIRIVPHYFPTAENLSIIAHQKFSEKDFENVSLIEPVYLKEYVSGKKI